MIKSISKIALSLAVVLMGVMASTTGLNALSTSPVSPINPMLDISRDGMVTTLDVEYAVIAREFYLNTGNLMYFADVNHDNDISLLDITVIGANVGKKVSKCNWADANSDGRVSLQDVELFAQNQTASVDQNSNRYDYNNDARVNVLDITFAAGQVGQVCK